LSKIKYIGGEKKEMGSIVDGAMAVMGILAGLMLFFMSLKASELVKGNFTYQSKGEGSPRSHKKVA
jgi:hypothetical protein